MRGWPYPSLRRAKSLNEETSHLETGLSGSLSSPLSTPAGHLSGTRDAALTETARTFLARGEGQVVIVQLRDRQLRGKLTGADEFINLVLEGVEEIGLRGEWKIPGPVVVRGSQVIAIHADKLGPPVVEERSERVWSGSSYERSGYNSPRGRFGSRARYEK